MKILNKIPVFIFIIVQFGANAQNADTDSTVQYIQSLAEQIVILQKRNIKLNKEINMLKTALSNIAVKTDSLQMQICTNSHAINTAASRFDVKIAEISTGAKQQIATAKKSLDKIALRAVIGILFAVIVSGVVYLLLRKKQRADKTDIIAQLSRTKQSIDETLIVEFAKNTEVLEIMSKMHKPLQIAEPDHSLALKVANEINLIERNISLMDSSIKGLKQLVRSLEKLKDNLMANGYEMPQLLNKQFHSGMKVIVASSIPDENLEKGSEIIKKILIPQVNYNGVMIQTAQIEVSVGY